MHHGRGQRRREAGLTQVPRPDPAALIAALAGRFPDAVFAGESLRAQHGRDESHHAAPPPDAVFLPGSTDAAAEGIRICARHRVPVIPYGTGSGQEGGVLAERGGISMGSQRLNRILEVNGADMDAHVEAGVTRLQLDAALRETGLFLPVDPGADASIGGMAATGAAGSTTPRYGTMHQGVIGLEAVMADGSVIRTGGRARKSTSGYDPTRLLVPRPSFPWAAEGRGWRTAAGRPPRQSGLATARCVPASTTSNCPVMAGPPSASQPTASATSQGVTIRPSGAAAALRAL